MEIDRVISLGLIICLAFQTRQRIATVQLMLLKHLRGLLKTMTLPVQMFSECFTSDSLFRYGVLLEPPCLNGVCFMHGR